MEIKNSLVSFRKKLNYHFEFLKHTKSESNHFVTKEDKRLRKVIIQNYLKSFTISNLFAVYINYISRNKTFMKTILSKHKFNLLFDYLS